VIGVYDATPSTAGGKEKAKKKNPSRGRSTIPKDRRLPADTANGAAFSMVLLDAVNNRRPRFFVVNETPTGDGGDRID